MFELGFFLAGILVGLTIALVVLILEDLKWNKK